MAKSRLIKKIGYKLRIIRKELNLSQESLSRKCGISQSTYSAYERGKHLISTLTIYAICKTYNISMDFMLNRTTKKTLNNKIEKIMEIKSNETNYRKNLKICPHFEKSLK